MPTQRFDHLEPDRQRLVLDAAAAEFAAHGYTAASMNRIIAAAGTSKGAMYYYFEDKADLYATVVRDTVARFVAHCGVPRPVDSADDYWREVERFVREGLAYYDIDPHLAGIVRSMGQDGSSVAPLAETRTVIAAFLEGIVTLGQQVGAVRTDLPRSLLLAITAALSEGIDLWLADHHAALSADEREAVIVRLFDLYRRCAAPLEHP